MEPITIITTCMGRLSFLQKALPNWLELTPWPVIVVDYSCPDGAGAWAAQFERVSVVYRTAETRDGMQLFNPSKARNAGAKAAEGEYFLFLDSDILLSKDFLPWVKDHLDKQTMCLGTVGLEAAPKLFGLLLVHRDYFNKVGGYDESFDNWGHEDIALYVWLHLSGMKSSYMHPRLVHQMPHSMELRTRYFINKIPAISRVANIRILSQKLRARTGKSYEEWLKEPEFIAFLNPVL